MTAREAAAAQLAALPDAEMEVVAGFLVWRNYLADIDEWGDLSAQMARASAEALRRLDEREREEFGETLWESWQRLEREGKIELPKPQPVPNPSMREAAVRARQRAGWLVEHLPEAEMPLILAFLAWRERSADLRREGADARMAVDGAEAMRGIKEAERRLFGGAWQREEQRKGAKDE